MVNQWNQVGIVGYQKTSMDKSEQIGIKHPMIRRMSLLQKAVVSAMGLFKEKYPDLWEQLKRNSESPIYYTTTFGEVDLLVKSSETVFHESFPMSPKVFQNSVNNAAIFYGQMVHELHNPYTASSQGYLSLDQILLVLFHKIRSGILSQVLVVNAHGIEGEDKNGLATVEIFMLDANIENAGAILKEIRFLQPNESQPESECLMIENENIELPWLNLDEFKSGRRVVKNAKNRGIVSEWV